MQLPTIVVYPLMMKTHGLPVTTPIDGDPEKLVPLLHKGL